MSGPFQIEYEGNVYAWAPAKSTPSVPSPVAELPQIVTLLKSNGAHVVVDFGCGRGRNASLLADNFDTVILVEDEANLPHLSCSANGFATRKNCVITSWNDYRSRSSPRVDAVLLCCVIHTIPSDELRREVINANRRRLTNGGVLVLVSPKGDSKYTQKSLTDAITFDDGIVRLYDESRSFSFYRNFSRSELDRLLSSAGLRVSETIPSRARHVLVTTRTRATTS